MFSNVDYSIHNIGLYSADIHLPTSSEHSLGATSLRHESWEFDSGARDLSPEPNALYKLIEAAGVSLTANPSQILEIANKVSNVVTYWELR